MRYLGFLLILVVSACSKDVDNVQDRGDCLKIEVLDAEKVGSSGVNIETIQLVDLCLEFTLSYSGCDGNHDIHLYMNSNEIEGVLLDLSLNLTFVDVTSEFCLAYFKQTYSYDVSEIDALITSGQELLLTFTKSDKTFLYKKP